MSKPGNTIAFFDFDGTLTQTDTMFVFFKYAKGPLIYYAAFFLLSPLFVLFKLKIVPGQFAKEAAMWLLFSGMKRSEIEQIGKRFCAEKIDPIIRPEGLKRLNWHREQGHSVYIVSASVEEWLKPWAESNGIPLICTSLLYKNDIFTGKLNGLNCNGPEKVRRIKEEINLSDFETIYAYGDTSGDREMLAIATHAEFKPFRS